MARDGRLARGASGAELVTGLQVASMDAPARGHQVRRRRAEPAIGFDPARHRDIGAPAGAPRAKRQPVARAHEDPGPGRDLRAVDARLKIRASDRDDEGTLGQQMRTRQGAFERGVGLGIADQ